jgi:hypothetical protein
VFNSKFSVCTVCCNRRWQVISWLSACILIDKWGAFFSFHAVQIVCGAHIMQNRPAGMVLDVACRLSCQLLVDGSWSKLGLASTGKIETSIYTADIAESKKLYPDNEIGNAMAWRNLSRSRKRDSRTSLLTGEETWFWNQFTHSVGLGRFPRRFSYKSCGLFPSLT